MTTTSSARLATSLPPPDPTRNDRPGMTVELMLPKRSIWAAPRHANRVVPGEPVMRPRICSLSESMVAVGKLRWLNTNGSAGVGS